MLWLCVAIAANAGARCRSLRECQRERRYGPMLARFERPEGALTCSMFVQIGSILKLSELPGMLSDVDDEQQSCTRWLAANLVHISER